MSISEYDKLDSRMQIYFCGSIRGDRLTSITHFFLGSPANRQTYKTIIEYLKGFGEVLTEHIGNELSKNLNYLEDEENELNHLEQKNKDICENDYDKMIHERDVNRLKSCDIVIAETTYPSLGVGYEIGVAVQLRKKIICLYSKKSGKRLSAMIAGCPSLSVIYYDTFDDIKETLGAHLTQFTNHTYTNYNDLL